MDTMLMQTCYDMVRTARDLLARDDGLLPRERDGISSEVERLENATDAGDGAAAEAASWSLAFAIRAMRERRQWVK